MALGDNLPPFLKQWFHRTTRAAGYQFVNLEKMYSFDGLHTVHRSPFREDPRFRAAHRRGVQAGNGVDAISEWRLHVGLWAASAAARVPGDFVECGVNAGVLSSAVLQYLNWNTLDKKFYLVDTFEGPALEQFSSGEIALGRRQIVEQCLADGAYVTDLDRIRTNYAEWRGVEIVKGLVPDILPQVTTPRVAFLHIDMNCALPEAAALRYFWNRMSPGGMVLFDDYAYFGYDAQMQAIDQTAVELGAEILAIPTGQGLIVK